MNPWLHLTLYLGWVLLLSAVFAKVEIHIEGKDGWAANLPTWQIEDHWLLHWFWGGRPMTGYHAWMFPFIMLVFHFPIFALLSWSWKLEARIIAAVAVFWICEDFLWFILNPAYGWRKFNRREVSWHRYWIAGAPFDYWLFLGIAAGLLWYSFFG